jgi:hypothetical protein
LSAFLTFKACGVPFEVGCYTQYVLIMDLSTATDAIRQFLFFCKNKRKMGEKAMNKREEEK